MSQAKKRQWYTAMAVFAVVSVIGMVAGMTISSGKKEREAAQKPIPKIEKSDFSKPDAILEGPALWQSQKGAQVDQLARRNEELERRLASLEKKDSGPTPSDLPNINLNKTLPPPPPNLNIKGPDGLDDGTQLQSINLNRSATMLGGSNGTGIGTAKNSNIPNSPQNFKVKGVRPNLVVTEDGGNVTYQTANASSTSTGRFRAQKSYIPSGTFFRAVLLGGLDAPTGGESANANPHPVLMRIDNLAQLPNRFRQNFKECFVTGTGYGELSSERDIAITGWVSGEDGKTGVRGRLVSKQGAVLKNALISGVLSGIGQGLSTAANVTNTSALGAVSSVSQGKQLQNALGTGAGGAFDRLAQYYIKLADKMFPVIEVDAGRRVDIVLLKGFQIGDD
jgi:conjugal transfer pilus assembly protein TraB